MSKKEFKFQNSGQFKEVPLRLRFFSHVDKLTSGCWEWVAGKDKNGYGRSSIKRKVIQAHRVSWVIHNGAIPDGLHVLHKCDNPPCVNPAHLFLGTNRDNSLDKINKNRQLKGERINTNKLSRDDVIYIRSSVKSGVSRVVLSDKFQVSYSTISDIYNGRSWRWLS